MEDRLLEQLTFQAGEQVRSACMKVAQEAYEQARADGLCAEGAFEVAMSALQNLDIGPIIQRQGGKIDSV